MVRPPICCLYHAYISNSKLLQGLFEQQPVQMSLISLVSFIVYLVSLVSLVSLVDLVDLVYQVIEFIASNPAVAHGS